MPKKLKGKSPQEIMAATQQMIKRLPLQVAAEAATEFQMNFDRQRFFSDQKWQARKGKGKKQSRSILVKKGNLRGAIEFEAIVSKARVYINPPYDKYGAIHNNGGTINKDARSELFVRNRYTRGKKSKMFGGLGAFKKGTKAGRGLTFKAHKIVIPKRQFIGNHKDLEKIINEFIQSQIKTSIK